MEKAPFFAEVAQGPDGGAAYWLRTDDGLRIRIGVWPEKGVKGTVLLFPGRTEYVEKYGSAAADLQARGFATVAIDWRGQGLADRLLDDRLIGHVGHFQDYQRDVRAMVQAARDLKLAEPFYLMAHSMGGAIGLRALLQDMPVKAAMFSAPMWGIDSGAVPGWVPKLVTSVAQVLGLGNHRAPGTVKITYVLENPFENNTLTHDPEMYQMMVDQSNAHRELILGGPSNHWVKDAIRECADLVAAPAPATPTLVHLGTDEAIVDTNAIRNRMASWPSARLEMVQGASHEVIIELPHIRAAFFDAAAALYEANR